MKTSVTVAALLALALVQSDRALSASARPWRALAFLEGTWDAHAQAGSAGAQTDGKNTFKPELKNHVLVRRSEALTACKGRASFGCKHSHVLSGYQEAENQPLKAIYLDNEGQVI